ncbi:MAG: ATP-dependent zinc metalloprotease FtsH [Clostridia bacterium]|nr:ATP-dependent zinc metalloprotease FtsH [Clostridia bacterium]
MKRQSRTLLWFVIGIVGIIFVLSLMSGYGKAQKVSYSTMYNYIATNDEQEEKNQITRIEVDKYKVTAYHNKKELYYTYYPRDNAITANELESLIRAQNITLSYTNPNAGSVWSSILPLLGTVVLFVLFILWMRSAQAGGKNGQSFGKTKARMSQNVKVRFSDVAGAEEEKEELKEVVEFLKNPRKFAELGARIPKGVLLVGPPGTGKTLFAKAVAGEANVPFFSMSGSDFVELYVGVGASRVRDLFDLAKKSQPCIIFIDEIDAVGRQRGTGLGGGHDEREQTLNQLLVQMDGFDTNEGIIVMAATNRADILDPALLRPGRFDRQVHVNLPDVRGREAILRVHARNKPLAPEVNFKVIARMTHGFAGADLENLLNEAAILTARDGRKVITNNDLYEGLDKVLAGPAKKSRLVTESDKRITAYHEAGHAVLAEVQPHCNKVHEVTIIPRGGAAGFTMTRPQNDDSHISKSMLMEEIVMALGGRVAEELVIQEVCTGASQDLKQVSEIARSMVTEFGMSDRIGPISFASDGEVFIGRDMASKNSYSEETANVIDEEIEKIVKTAHERATELLTLHRDKLDTMARCLVERETIYEEEVELIMQGKSAKEVCEEMDARLSGKANPFQKVTDEIAKEEGASQATTGEQTPAAKPAASQENAESGDTTPSEEEKN